MKTSVVGSFFKRAQVGNVVTVWPPQCHPNNELVCLRQQTMPSAIFSFDKCWLVWIFSALGHYLTKSSKWTPFKTIDKFIPDFNSMSLTRPSICVNQEFIQLNPAIYNPEMVVEKYFIQSILFPFAINNPGGRRVSKDSKGSKPRLISRITSCKLDSDDDKASNGALLCNISAICSVLGSHPSLINS